VSRTAALATLGATLCLAVLGAPSVRASGTDASVVQVIDPATLAVQLDTGAAERVRLIGLDPAPSPTGGCRVDAGTARTQALIGSDPISVELVGTPPERDTDGNLLGDAWLLDGRNLAEVLLREGDVRRTAGAGEDPRSAAFAAAQNAAVADRIGIWAPGACQGLTSAQTADGALLGAFVSSSGDALQRASIGVNVLREQARSAPLLMSTASWQQTTAMGINWAREGSDGMRAPTGAGQRAQPLADELVQLGGRLQGQADAYMRGVSAGDVGQVQGAATQLSATGDALVSAAAELNAFAAAYGVGD